MKVWIGFGSEHSANLVIIGHFENPDEASANLQLLEKVRSVAEADEKDGRITAGKVANIFSEALMNLYKATELSLNYGDEEQFLYEFHAKQEDSKIIITTDEQEVNAFVKVLLHGGARIEVYSAHQHGGAYGRRTKNAD